MRRAVGNKTGRDFAVFSLLAAVAGAISQAIGTVIEIGRAAGWWL
jgi:hypothetical protein